jgi:integrase
MLETRLTKTDNDFIQRTGEVDIVAQRVFEKKSQRNAEWFSEIFELTTKNSQAALKYDGNCLRAWFNENPQYILNTDLENNEDVLKLYFTHMINSDLKRATIVRHKDSVNKILKAMSLANPFIENSLFGDWLKAALKVKPAAQKQAEGMDHKSLAMINENLSNECPLEFRNKLIFNIAFDALLRASEVCAIKIEHIDFNTETVYIPSSKTDQTGQGEYLYLSDTTINLIKQWIPLLKRKTGYLLRSLSPKKDIRNAPLKYRTILDAFRFASILAGKEYGFFTGHSGRVGGAVTLAEAGASLFDIQRAGRWANAAMPVRYTKKASARLTGMGKIAKGLGR